MNPSDFVNWNQKEGRFNYGRAHFESFAEAERFLAKPVASSLTELVAELTAYFGRIGMHEICRKCFAGEKLPAIEGVSYYGHEGHHGAGGTPGRGCCSPCNLQGKTSCLSKPLGCAAWMCHYTTSRFPEAETLLAKIKSFLYYDSRDANGRSLMQFFNEPRPVELTLEQEFHVSRAILWLKKAM